MSLYQHIKNARIQKEDRSGPPTLENYRAIGFLSNTGPDALNKHKATKPAIVGPTSARQQNANLMAFCRQFDDGPLLMVFGSSLPSSTKKQEGRRGPGSLT